MEKSFWTKKWEVGDTKFNQSEPNAALQKYFHSLSLNAGDKIFVPLCGKSIDLVWLANQGVCVIGVEFSDIACQDFFKENGLTFEKKGDHNFTKYISDNITLYCGDYFALTPKDVGELKAFYDRASLIALPPHMRAAYARKLAQLMPSESRGLLLTIIYDENEMQGPPFSITDNAVTSLFAEDFSVNLLENKTGEIPPHLSKKGLKEAKESILSLKRK